MHASSGLTNGTAPQECLTPAQRRAARFWPALIITLIGGQVALATMALYYVTVLGPPTIEPDYYRKAVDWNAHAAQQATNRKLEWTLKIDVSPETDAVGRRVVRTTLQDAHGAALPDARIEGLVFHHADGRNRIALTFTSDTAPGAYRSLVPLTREGLHEFRLIVQRGSDRFTHDEQLHVGPPRGMFRWGR